MHNLKVKSKGIEEDLERAIIEDEKDKALDLIKILSNVNYKNSNNKSFLQLAIEKGNLDIIKALLNKNVILEDKKDVTKIYDLALYDSYGLIDILIKKGYRLEEGVLEDNKYFCFLCYSTNAQEVEKFINHNKNINPVNIKDKYNRNLLTIASIGSKKDIIEMLINDYKFNINEKNGNEWGSLMYTVKNGNKKILNLLISYNINLNEKTNLKSTPLMLACKEGHKDIAKILIDKGANVNDKNDNGFTALMFSSKNGYTEVVKMLLDNGAKINDKNNNNYTALMISSGNNHKEVVEILLERGANVNDTDNQSATSLIKSSYHGHKEIVRILIEKGANLNDAEKDGCTALILASFKGHKEIVELLIERGANVNDRNNNGSTALMIASQNGNIEVTEKLLKANVNIYMKDELNKTALIHISEKLKLSKVISKKDKLIEIAYIIVKKMVEDYIQSFMSLNKSVNTPQDIKDNIHNDINLLYSLQKLPAELFAEIIMMLN